MRVIFMGTPEFAVPSLERLILSQFEVVAVYTQPDKVAGRGRSQVESAVKRKALYYQVPVIQTARLKNSEELERTGVGIIPHLQKRRRQKGLDESSHPRHKSSL